MKTQNNVNEQANHKHIVRFAEVFINKQKHYAKM